MRYFALDIHAAYTPPRLTKWHGILDQKTVRDKKRNLIPKYTLFQIENHMQTVFTDILFHPCFMVSKKVMDVIKLYEPSLRFERVALSDQVAKKIFVYYIPILEELDVLTGNSRVANDKCTLEYIEIDGKKVKHKAIFQLENNGKIYVLVHLDLIESLLRRKAIGVDLKVVDTI